MKSKKQIYSQGGTIFDNPNFVAQGISTGANLAATAIDTFVEDEKERVNPTKDMATGALRMGGQGAAIGTMVAPGIGTAIGGGLGLLIGGATAYNNSQKQAKEINDNIMDSRYGEENKDKYFPWSGGTLFAEGGNLDPTIIQGSTHEEGGVSLSPQVEVEKDEVVWNKYVFSNRIVNPKTNQTFADDAKKIIGKYKERDSDPYSEKSLNKEMEALRVVHEVEKMKIEQDRLAKEQKALDQVNRYGDSIGDDLQVNNPQMKEELIQMAMGGGIPYESLVKDIYSNKIKYRNGGGLPQNPPTNPPTSNDSLMIYNNAKLVDSYYKKNYELMRKNPSTGNLHELSDKASSAFEQTKKLEGVENEVLVNGGYRNANSIPYRQDLDKDKYLQRELDYFVLDLNAPYSLYDKRIQPQFTSHYQALVNTGEMSAMRNDVDVVEYDPIAIKPWAMSTPEEKAEKIRLGYHKVDGTPVRSAIESAVRTSATIPEKLKPRIIENLNSKQVELGRKEPNLNFERPLFDVPKPELPEKLDKYYYGKDEKNEKRRLEGKSYTGISSTGYELFIPSGDLDKEKEGRVGYYKGEGFIEESPDIEKKKKMGEGGPLRPEERVNLGIEQSQISPLFWQGFPRYNKLDGSADSPLVDNLSFVDYSKPDPNQPFSFNRINLPKENTVPIKSFTGSHNETTIGYPEGQSIGREDLYRTTLQPKSINLIGDITNNSRRFFDGATVNDLPATNTQTSANNIVDPRASKSTFGNEEAALLASSAAGLDNLIKSFNPETTSFDRVNLERLNLEKIREQNRRNSDRSFNQFSQSIRGSGLSSGEVLSGLATGSSSVNRQRMEGDLSTYLQEEQANTQISNQESQLNNQISREETIANEQNRAAAKSAGNLALSDLGTNAQGYMKDKKMGAENLRYNEQVKDLINQFFPNYKFGTNPSTDKILVEFVNNYKPNK